MGKTFKAPRLFTVNYIKPFLKEIEPLFSMPNRMETDVEFDLTEVEDVDILGLLLTYKFVEYSAVNNCFYSPTININRSSCIYRDLVEYGFWDLLQDYINDKSADYGKLDFQLKGKKEKFFIAPLPLLRTQCYSQTFIRENFLPKIEEYYRKASQEIKGRTLNLPKITSMILQCLSEILLNFWEHAVEDTKSIITAIGTVNHVEIVCADTGKGIISNLSPVLGIPMSKYDILAKSLEQGVTSKKETNHMGCGLWILERITMMTKGRLFLFSEGAYIMNDFGKFSKGDCAYWKGTIIYVFLPLSSPKTLCDIEDLATEDFNDIKINFQ